MSKRDFICRADQLHFALEIFFRENPSWEDSYICADKHGIYGVRMNYFEDDIEVQVKTIYGLEEKDGGSS